MSRPTTLTFEEAAFTMPWHENRQVIHNQAYDVLLKGQHIPDNETTRPFVFDVTLLDPATKLALVTARGLQLTAGLPVESTSLTVKEGDTLTIRTRVSAMIRKTVQAGGKEREQEVFVPAHEVGPWATKLLGRNGMTTSNVKLLDFQHRRAYKRNTAFGINEAFLEAQVTIESVPEFTKAYLSGIGRHKGYGYGLIEVVS